MANENIEKFVLHKVERTLGGLKISYSETNKAGETTEITTNFMRPPHPDFDKVFYCIESAYERVISPNVEGRFDLVGLTFAGKESNRGVSASGMLDTVVAVGAVRIKTRRVKYLISDADICAKLSLLVPDLEREVQTYIYEGKSAETDDFENL